MPRPVLICCSALRRCWHDSDLATCPLLCRCWGNSGRRLIINMADWQYTRRDSAGGPQHFGAPDRIAVHTREGVALMSDRASNTFPLNAQSLLLRSWRFCLGLGAGRSSGTGWTRWTCWTCCADWAGGAPTSSRSLDGSSGRKNCIGRQCRAGMSMTCIGDRAKHPPVLSCRETGAALEQLSEECRIFVSDG